MTSREFNNALTNKLVQDPNTICRLRVSTNADLVTDIALLMKHGLQYEPTNWINNDITKI